jgi:hypothetical protein
MAMHHPHVLAVVLCAAASISSTQPVTAVTKEALKAEYTGICKNPDATFPKPVPAEKKAAFLRWCSCMGDSIDSIPESRLQQTVQETYEEYAQYKQDPAGFIPVKEFSLVRRSKACTAQARQ